MKGYLPLCMVVAFFASTGLCIPVVPNPPYLRVPQATPVGPAGRYTKYKYQIHKVKTLFYYYCPIYFNYVFISNLV